jgi:DNA-binding CsgD family transcriptional regulator
VAGTGVVGRDTELYEVDRFLDQLEREPGALAIEGEAGIGKSTIWTEARHRAERRGATVLGCRASGAEAKFSFAGLSDLLASTSEVPWEAVAAPQREALEVALLRAPPTRRAPIPRAVAAGFLALVGELARSHPVVIAIDDLQWLDAPSRGVLEFAVRRLETEPVGILYTRRLPADVPGLEQSISGGRMRRLSLRPLSLGALAQIVSAQLGQVLPRPVLVRILQLVGGNPFYVLETARLLIEQGMSQSPGSELPVPDDLRALAASRIRRLPSAARDTLLLTAVLSNPDSQTVDLDALGPAEEAGIVTVDGRGRIEFSHPLFASAAYGSVSTARRRELHRRAAEVAGDVEQRARHLALASDRPDPEISKRLDEASALARARGAPDTAAELAELAAERTLPSDGATRAARLLSAARLHIDTGHLGRAELLAHEVLSADRGHRASAEALQLIAQLRGRQTGFGEAAEVGERALTMADGDDRLSAEIELDLAFFGVSLGDLPGAQTHATAAVGHAETSGDGALLADALAGLSVMQFLGGGGLPEQEMGRALALEDPLRVRTFQMRPSGIHGMLQLWTGDTGTAIETLERLHTEAIDRGQEGVAPLLTFYLVWACLWDGEFAAATAFADQCLEACAVLDDPMLNGTSLSGAALLHAHTGPLELARDEARRAIAIFDSLEWRTAMIWPCWALGLAEMADGRADHAQAVLGPLADQLAAMGTGDPGLGMVLPVEVESLIGLGQLDAAERRLGAFGHLAREHRRDWAIAAAARCEGALEAARGRQAEAFWAFERALAAHEEARMPFERARTLMLAGQAHRRFKQRGIASELLDEARDVFAQLGAEPWAARARDELARIGRRSPSRDELTAGERQVAELVASGLSNREVAERAFLSIKTVEATLTRVYRKLGVRSRVELARATDEAETP